MFWHKKTLVTPIAHKKSFFRNPIAKWKEHIHENKVVRDAVESLIQNSHLQSRFLVMSLLSGCMATIGILLNDVVILIAAMVLAPLLNPLLSFAGGISLGHAKLIWFATKGFVGGILAVIVPTILIIQLLQLLGYSTDVSHFITRFENERTVFLITFAAFISGIAAVYSWLRINNYMNLVGVAIAVSLVPLISFLGILIGKGNWSSALHFSVWLGFSLAFLIIGALFAFVLLGFSQPQSRINRDLSEADKET